MRDTINDIPVDVFLELIERLESQSDPSYPHPPSFDWLLSQQGVFLQSPIRQIMAQPGYPDNIDWDVVIEDGGLGLLSGE